jgi:arabinofuranan 3-O-arabinosyltransferase
LPDACRSDLIAANGTGVPVRVVGERAAAERGEPFALEPCADALQLVAGDNEVRTAGGAVTAINVDRIVLASAVGGAAAVPGPVAPGSAPVPALRVTDRGPVSATAVVDRPDEPFWFVFGQSYNAGWELKVEGGSASPRTLVDGYANGWLITPDGSGAPITLSVAWTPQRVVFVAIGISAATLLACLAIVVTSWVVARRRGLRFVIEPVVATVANPFGGAAGSERLAWPPLVARVIAVGAVGWLVAGSLPAVAVAAVALVVGLAPRWRWCAPLASAAIIMGCGAAIVVLQVRNAYPPVFEWPTYFPALHPIAWTAILLLPLPWVMRKPPFLRNS